MISHLVTLGYGGFGRIAWIVTEGLGNFGGGPTPVVQGQMQRSPGDTRIEPQDREVPEA